VGEQDGSRRRRCSLLADVRVGPSQGEGCRVKPQLYKVSAFTELVRASVGREMAATSCGQRLSLIGDRARSSAFVDSSAPVGALEGQRICVRWHRWVLGLGSGSHRSLACCRSHPSRRAMHRSKAPALEHEGCYGERQTPSRVGLGGGVEHPGWSPVCQWLGAPI